MSRRPPSQVVKSKVYCASVQSVHLCVCLHAHLHIAVYSRSYCEAPVSPWGELLGKHLGVNKTTSDNMLMERFIIPPPLPFPFSSTGSASDLQHLHHVFVFRGRRRHGGGSAPFCRRRLINISSGAPLSQPAAHRSCGSTAASLLTVSIFRPPR